MSAQTTENLKNAVCISSLFRNPLVLRKEYEQGLQTYPRSPSSIATWRGHSAMFCRVHQNAMSVAPLNQLQQIQRPTSGLMVGYRTSLLCMS